MSSSCVSWFTCAACLRKNSGSANKPSMRATSASTAWICASMPSSSRDSLKESFRGFAVFVAASRESAADFSALLVARMAALCRDAAPSAFSFSPGNNHNRRRCDESSRRLQTPGCLCRRGSENSGHGSRPAPCRETQSRLPPAHATSVNPDRSSVRPGSEVPAIF